MNDRLWKLAETLEDDPHADVPESTLRAYRDGDLSPEERERVERVLIASSRVRARLIAMAGDRVAGPPDAIRRRLRRRIDLRRPRARRFPPLAAVAAVAAALILALALTAWIGREAPADFERIAFDVRIQGVSDVRSGGATGDLEAVADPDALVDIVIETDNPVEGLSFGLYRRDGDRFERVPESRYTRFERFRGAASIRVSARALVPPRPGRHNVYIVVGRRSDLPDRWTAPSDDAADPVAGLERAAGGTVRPIRLTLRPAAAAPDPPREESR